MRWRVVSAKRSNYNKPEVITDSQKVIGRVEVGPGGGGSFTGRALRLDVAAVSKISVKQE
jgi:hypothetical protein